MNKELKNFIKYWEPKLFVGSDPEIFITTTKGNTIIPAFSFLPAKKETQVEDSYWDGFQAEFNTIASESPAIEIVSIARALKKLESKSLSLRGDAKLSSKSVVKVSKALLAKTKKQHKAFGCIPSFNAYGEMPSFPREEDLQERTAGGHLHFGYTANYRPTSNETVDIVKNLDATIGVIGVALFNKLDSNTRRNYYGRAGEYRTPPHGIEYRVLSNAWLMHPESALLIKTLSKIVVILSIKRAPTFEWLCDEEEIRTCINTNDKKLALQILEENKESLLTLLDLSTDSEEVKKKWLSMIKKGMSKNQDISANWNLANVRAA